MRNGRIAIVGLVLLAATGCDPGGERAEHPRLVPVEGVDALRREIDEHEGPVVVEYGAPG